MYIEVERTDKNKLRTIGSLFIDSSWVCYTIEDPVRDVKVQNETAIPAGTYQVIINHSPHFGRDMPLLLNVPGYVGVRIHYGNTPADTEGCILVGLNRTENTITESRLAFGLVFDKIKKALDAGEEVTLHIS